MFSHTYQMNFPTTFHQEMHYVQLLQSSISQAVEYRDVHCLGNKFVLNLIYDDFNICFDSYSATSTVHNPIPNLNSFR